MTMILPPVREAALTDDSARAWEIARTIFQRGVGNVEAALAQQVERSLVLERLLVKRSEELAAWVAYARGLEK